MDSNIPERKVAVPPGSSPSEDGAAGLADSWEGEAEADADSKVPEHCREI